MFSLHSISGFIKTLLIVTLFPLCIMAIAFDTAYYYVFRDEFTRVVYNWEHNPLYPKILWCVITFVFYGFLSYIFQLRRHKVVLTIAFSVFLTLIEWIILYYHVAPELPNLRNCSLLYLALCLSLVFIFRYDFITIIFPKKRVKESTPADLLGRSIMYTNVARLIWETFRHLSDKRGVICAVVGPWGSGKTHFLRFLEDYLCTRPDENNRKESTPAFNEDEMLPISSFRTCHVNLWQCHSKEEAWDRIENELVMAISNRRFSILKRGIKFFLKVFPNSGISHASLIGAIVEMICWQSVQPYQEAGDTVSDKINIKHRKMGVALFLDDIERANADLISALPPLLERLRDIKGLLVCCAIAQEEMEDRFATLYNCPKDTIQGYHQKLFDATFEIPAISDFSAKYMFCHLLHKNYAHKATAVSSGKKSTADIYKPLVHFGEINKYQLMFDTPRQIERSVVCLANTQWLYFRHMHCDRPGRSMTSHDYTALNWVYIVELLRTQFSSVLKEIGASISLCSFLRDLPPHFSHLNNSEEVSHVGDVKEQQQNFQKWKTNYPETAKRIAYSRLLRSLLRALLRMTKEISPDGAQDDVAESYFRKAYYLDYAKKIYLKTKDYREYFDHFKVTDTNIPTNNISVRKFIQVACGSTMDDFIERMSDGAYKNDISYYDYTQLITDLLTDFIDNLNTNLENDLDFLIVLLRELRQIALNGFSSDHNPHVLHNETTALDFKDSQSLCIQELHMFIFNNGSLFLYSILESFSRVSTVNEKIAAKYKSLLDEIFAEMNPDLIIPALYRLAGQLDDKCSDESELRTLIPGRNLSMGKLQLTDSLKKQFENTLYAALIDSYLPYYNRLDDANDIQKKHIKEITQLLIDHTAGTIKDEVRTTPEVNANEKIGASKNRLNPREEKMTTDLLIGEISELLKDKINEVRNRTEAQVIREWMENMIGYISRTSTNDNNKQAVIDCYARAIESLDLVMDQLPNE